MNNIFVQLSLEDFILTCLLKWLEVELFSNEIFNEDDYDENATKLA